MKKYIQVIERSTGKVVLTIKTLKQLLDLFNNECFEEQYQKKVSVEKLIFSNRKTALSLNFLWEARLIEESIERKNERKSKK